MGRLKNFLVLAFLFLILILFPFIEAHELTPKITFSCDFRYEKWNYFKFQDYQNNYAFYGLKLKPLIKIPFSYESTLNVGLNIVGLGNLPSRAVAPLPAGPLGLGANYFSSNRSLNNDSIVGIAVRELSFNYNCKKYSFKIGRFPFSDGKELDNFLSKEVNFLKTIRITERMIGAFGFTYVERAFDGFAFNYNPKDNIQLSLANFYPTFGAFEISTANRTIRNINLSYFSYSFAPNKDTDFRTYFINYKDSRNILKPSNTPNIRGKTDISSVGFHFVKVIRKENYNIDLMAWYNYQWGKWGEIDSNKITHKAYAYDIEIGYKFNKILWKPHFRVYYAFGSGDPNPNDDKHNTYFVFVPTGRKYALFPFYNYQNLKDLTFQLIAYPSRNLRLRIDYSILSLANNQDGWYSGAGAFNDSSFGVAYKRSNGLSKLADVLSLDISYNLSTNITINLFYSLAQGKDLVKDIYHSSNSTYLLLILTQKI